MDLRPGRAGQKFCTAGRSGCVRFAYGDNTTAPKHREFGANSTASPRESARISSHHETWIVRDRRHTQHKISARFAAIHASIRASFRPVRESRDPRPRARGDHAHRLRDLLPRTVAAAPSRGQEAATSIPDHPVKTRSRRRRGATSPGRRSRTRRGAPEGSRRTYARTAICTIEGLGDAVCLVNTIP